MDNLVRCNLSGGPHDGTVIDLPLGYCRETLAVAVNWSRVEADGSVSVFEGSRPGGKAEWHCQSNAIYEKSGKPGKRELAYRYVRVAEVKRCEAISATSGRRCLHPAEKGVYCPTHTAKSKESK